MNRLNRFWQELKRRNIVRKNTVYLATAYVIIEFTSIITEPFGLPEWTLKLVFVLLGLGLIGSLILSWYYNFTSEGLQKNEPASLAEMVEKAAAGSPKRKLKASDVVIAVLAVMVGVLAYPRIFKGGGNLNAMTRSVTVLNEYGEEETHEVFKENYLTRLAIFPFASENQDSSLHWLGHGIYEGVGEDLDQFSYISVNWNRDVTQLNEQIKRARTNNYPRFLTGTIRKEGDVYQVSSRIYRTDNGTILAERAFSGTDLFVLIDSISLQTRMDLGISDRVLKSSVDLPFKVHYTDNLEAFECVINGFYSGSHMENMNKAIELDSTFAIALASSASFNFNFQVNRESALKDIRQAMRHRHRLSEADEITLRMYYYAILGEPDKAIALAEMQYELQPANYDILLDLYRLYWINSRFDEMEEALLKLNELVPDEPEYQLMLAESHLLTGKLDKGIELLEKLLAQTPDNTEVLLKLGEFYLHKNKVEEAMQCSQKAIMFNPEEEEHWSMIYAYFDYIRNRTKEQAALDPFTGYFRYEGEELVISNTEHNHHLLTKALNQTTMFLYPVSDSVFISYDGFFKNVFVRDQQNVITKYTATQRNIPGPSTVWKEDELIQNAWELLAAGKDMEALSAFRSAYEKHPGHHYLAPYIRHLEFKQSPGYASLAPVFDSYPGTYGKRVIYFEGDQLYYRNTEGSFYRLLPLASDHFIVPKKDFQLFFTQENGAPSGIKIVSANGNEAFYPGSN